MLLAGVTFFFGIAHVNGTVDRLIGRVLVRVDGSPLAIPAVFFGLTGLIAAMGSPLGGLVLAPPGMAIAKRAGVDPVLMRVAVTSGISAGGFAPTSLFGIVTYGTAQDAGIALNPLTLFGVAVAVNLVVLIAASLFFGRRLRAGRNTVRTPRAPRRSRPPRSRSNGITLRRSRAWRGSSSASRQVHWPGSLPTWA